MADTSILALAGFGIALGLRHGIDWDHIAAITDITSSTIANDDASRNGGTIGAPSAKGAATRHLQLAGRPAAAAPETAGTLQRRRELREGFALATLYALGHATLVIVLGGLAIWASTLLPDWIDPLMERLVGLTLLFLGGWIVYSLVRYGRDFRLQSRWMVIFSLTSKGWARLRSRLTGRPMAHTHDLAQYGPRTAFGIGMLHGVGAETGSQAVLLASAAGATTRTSGSVLLFFFTIGLLLSNSLVAAFSAFGFVSASAKRTLYLAVGIFAAIFSLVVGFLFLTGQGALLPDLEALIGRFFGGNGAGN